jgi:hypothetical protein
MINLGVVVVERSCGYAGEFLFRNSLGPLMDTYMNHYALKFAFPSLIRGQHTSD